MAGAVPGIVGGTPRARAASAIPSAKGTARAKRTQTRRIDQVGIREGRGTKARTRVASRGQTMPSRRIGQAAAAPTRPESHAFSRLVVWPKSATTAHPKSDDRMLPSERLMRARIAWTMAIGYLSVGQDPSYSRRRSRRAGLPTPCAPFRSSLALDTRERCFTWRRALTRQRRWRRRGHAPTATGNPHPVVRRRGRAVAVELILAGRLNRGLSRGKWRRGRHGGF